MIQELCEYIDVNTSLTLGTTLFADGVDSDKIDECTVITETAPGLVDGWLIDKRQIPLTLYARATTRFVARNNAYTVFNFLHGKIQVTVGPVGSGAIYICNIKCSTPYYLGLDESGRRHVFSMPIDVNVTNML
jgi:hypothetical protein